MKIDDGKQMLAWAKDLFPINRSLTGAGVRETINYLSALLPDLQIHEIPSGTKVSDWTVPKEWIINDAYIAKLDGTKVVDFKDCNLHVVGYSIPINSVLSRKELETHLHSLPEQPTAIPYVTSYYSETWGFCISEEQRKNLIEDSYQVVIDSKLFDGNLTYAELFIPGDSKEEVLLSTYVCHPSMANNELSGPVVTTALARWLKGLSRRRYSYRILFIPETIGSITYISQNINHLREHVVAGWVLTCIGDNRIYSYVPSRYGNTLADRVSRKVLKERGFDFIEYSFLDRGSDERQWCSPGVDLPVCSLMRSKYLEYPEYHTSLDNFDVVTSDGLQGGFELMADAITLLENNSIYRSATLGEPQLGKRNLYPNTSSKKSGPLVRQFMNVLAYTDGTNDTIEISELTGVSTADVVEYHQQLFQHNLIV